MARPGVSEEHDEAIAARRRRVVAGHRQGHDAARIARDVGCSTRTVGRDLKAAGLHQEYRFYTDDEVDTARAMLAYGGSYRSVALALGRRESKHLRTLLPGYGHAYSKSPR